MKIINHGTTPDRVRFACFVCRCVFEAERGEYGVRYNLWDEKLYECECPECGSDCREKADDK